MSLNVWACFQRGMSLNGSRWVDHGSHGDRHERDASVRAGAAQGFSGGDGGNPVPVRRGRRGALLAHPSGAQALCLPSAQAGGQGAGAALSGSHDGLFTATVDPSGAAVLGHRRACQALPSAGTGLCPKVHGGRCGAFGRDRCPARHALGTGHQAFDAACFVGLLGHPLCAAGVHLGGASLQPAGRRRLPGAPPTLGQDASHRYPDRGAPRAATGRAPRLPAHRQRPPGR
jgi:hypothetical protein